MKEIFTYVIVNKNLIIYKIMIAIYLALLLMGRGKVLVISATEHN